MFKGHTYTIEDIALSPNGRSLVTGSQDASVRTWNLRDGSSKVMPVTEKIFWFNAVTFSPDGRYIAARHIYDALWIWDSRTHKLVAKLQGHIAGVSCIEFTPDGQGLMYGSDDWTIKYWDISSLGTGSDSQSFPEIRTFSGHSAVFFRSLLSYTLTETTGPH